MNRLDHLMVRAMEECDEVSQRISKALVFGLDEIQPGQDKTNAQRITDELSDLMGVLEMIQDEGVKLGDFNARPAISAKKMKVERYLELSRKQGRLEP